LTNAWCVVYHSLRSPLLRGRAQSCDLVHGLATTMDQGQRSTGQGQVISSSSLFRASRTLSAHCTQTRTSDQMLFTSIAISGHGPWSLSSAVCRPECESHALACQIYPSDE
jgi:hypothetical protein